MSCSNASRFLFLFSFELLQGSLWDPTALALCLLLISLLFFPKTKTNNTATVSPWKFLHIEKKRGGKRDLLKAEFPDVFPPFYLVHCKTNDSLNLAKKLKGARIIRQQSSQPAAWGTAASEYSENKVMGCCIPSDAAGSPGRGVRFLWQNATQHHGKSGPGPGVVTFQSLVR